MKTIAEYAKNNLQEMANITKKRHPELPANIFIFRNDGISHEPRIKIQRNSSTNVQEYDMFSMTISNKPEIVGNTGKLSSNEVKYFVEFIKRNMKVLIDYWNAKIYIEDVLENLKY